MPRNPGLEDATRFGPASGLTEALLSLNRCASSSFAPFDESANNQARADKDAGPAEEVAVLIVEGPGTSCAEGKQGDEEA